MYALIEDGAVKKYPYSLSDLKKANPNVSFAVNIDAATLATYGVYTVFNNPEPEAVSSKVVYEGVPEFSNTTQRWEQVWLTRDKFPEEISQELERLQQEVVSATQERLDTFAQTRNYDGILSACTYAGSTVAKFAQEGQYCVELRDATWTKLYEILAEVEAGTREFPTGFADIESELPPLAWPIL